jgi:hypothetical protein
MMQADYSVALMEEDPALEVPWSSDDGSVRYFNLRIYPALLVHLPEAARYPELSAFLGRINAAGFPLESAKSDAWFDRELTPEEDVFGANCKFVSYVDLLFSDESQRFSLDAHTMLAECLCDLLQRAPEMAATAEFIVRHCYYHTEGQETESRIGFCLTSYATGYGDSEEEARQRWSIGLKLVQHALVQVAMTKS